LVDFCDARFILFGYCLLYLRGAMIQSQPIVSKSTTNGCRQQRFLFLNESSQSSPTFLFILLFLLRLFGWWWLTSISKYGTCTCHDNTDVV
jgi:hypothetical protein